MLKLQPWKQSGGDACVSKWGGTFTKIEDNAGFEIYGIKISPILESTRLSSWKRPGIYRVTEFWGEMKPEEDWVQVGLREAKLSCDLSWEEGDFHENHLYIDAMEVYIWYAGGDDVDTYFETLRDAMDYCGIPASALWEPSEYNKLYSFDTDDEEAAWLAMRRG